MQCVGIALRDQAADALIETERRPKVAAQNSLPIMQILLSKGHVKTVRVARSGNISCRRAFAEHLQDGVAWDEMDQKKNDRHDQPDDGSRVRGSDQ